VGRLQVGNVEVDDSTIRIRGAIDGAVGGRREAVGEPDPIAALNRLRIAPRTVSWTGAALIGGGATLFCVTSGPLDVFAMVTRGGVLMSAGLALLAYGWLAGRIVAARKSDARRKRESEEAPYADAVSGLIRQPAAHQTVEWIAEQSGLSAAQVVRALALLRRRGELVEDLNAETGDFHYWMTGPSRSLDSRLRMLGDIDEK